MKKGGRQGEATGEVFTRPEVVAYMIDAVCRCGSFKSLLGLRVLEPSCGDGAFALPLVEAWLAERPDFESDAAETFLCACDISKRNVEKLREALKVRLVAAGCPAVRADALLSRWLVCDDFLLHDFKAAFDIVIGNPPYIRFDDISATKQREYRAMFPSFAERCDIYVPFFEKSLALLSDRGVFSFICTNRFTKSSYGKQLRRLIADRYHVALYLNMEHSQPFVEEVSAHPAIYVIDRNRERETYSATVDAADDVYVNAQRTADIERSCLLPLVASEDIHGGRISWDERYLLNPYDDDDDRRMRDLDRYPLAAAYLDSHSRKLKARYCARKHPHDWYRTLDRVKYSLLRSPKILIPDIQMGGNVALDERGAYYPHHNVYWITSTKWNLKALCALLRSSFVTSQIRNVSVQMRGGSIRYQAQNLRNVHIPAWNSLDEDDVERLVGAYEANDADRLDAVVDAVVREATTRQPVRHRQAELF